MRGSRSSGAALYAVHCPSRRQQRSVRASMLRRTYSICSGSGLVAPAPLDEGPSQLLRQPVHVRAEADRAQELGRLRRLDRPRLQPAADVAEAGGARAALPSPPRRRSSTARRSPRSKGRRARGGDLGADRAQAVDVAGAAALRGDRAAGAQHGRAGAGRAGRDPAPSGRRRWRRPRRPAGPAPARSGRRPAPRRRAAGSRAPSRPSRRSRRRRRRVPRAAARSAAR